MTVARQHARAIVLTGLPASGKSTIGHHIAEVLGFPFLDKDDFLERLYEREGVSDWENRKRLSRQSDLDFQDAAAKVKDHVVLVSHWRPFEGSQSGTPTEWLKECFAHLQEVCCLCDPEIAAERFLARRRHPGHLDALRDREEVEQRMRSLASAYPLGLGQQFSIATSAWCREDLNSLTKALDNTSHAPADSEAKGTS